jgi:tetratricopeptide (TPR) repeat protein
MKEVRAGKAIFVLALILAVIPSALFSQILKQEITNALQASDTVLAVDLLQKEIKLDPSFGFNYYTLGQIYANQGKLDLAEQQFQLSYEKGNKFFDGLYALGMVQLKLGKFDAAEKNFGEGLKKSKELKAQFHNGLGLTFIAKGDYNAADREMRQAIVLDSANAEFHINLGDANFMMKIYPLALTEYEKALQIDTASLEVYFHMAEACLELKDYTCALEKLKIVLRKDSTHAEAWMRAGGIYYKAARSTKNTEEMKQRFMETIGSYKKFIDLTTGKPDSTTGRAFYETGMAYLMIGGYDEAKQYFATVLGIPVEPKDIYFYNARAFHGLKEFDSAAVYYQKHLDWAENQGDNLKSSISDVELYRWLGEAQESLKDYPNALIAYLKSLEYDSTQERVLYGTAVCHNFMQDYRNALIYYMKRIALGVDEKNWPIYYNAATSALYLSEKSSQQSGQSKPDTTTDSTGIAVGPDPLAGIELPRLAAEYLEKVMEFKPDNAKAANMLASTYLYQLNDCPKATTLFEKVLTLEPDNCDAMKSLGYAGFAGLCSKNYTRALDFLNKALSCLIKKNGSESSDINLLLWIAQTYHFRAVDKREAKQKDEAKIDFKAAFDWYNKVLKYEPNNKAAIEGRDQVRFEY